MGHEIPNTVVECDGCGEDLNLLAPYLDVMVKPKREVLVSEEEPDPDDPDAEFQLPNLYLGTKSGRGVIKKFHDFKCAGSWFKDRASLKPKLEPHREDEIYVPEDNPDDKELARRAKAEAEGSEG